VRAEVSLDPNKLMAELMSFKYAQCQGADFGHAQCQGASFRGAALAQAGMNRVTGDHMGMLATVINALAIGDACKRANIDALVMSGFPIGGGVCDPVDHNKAKQALSMGKVVIFPPTTIPTSTFCLSTDLIISTT
jgi:uridylate kinase